MTNPRRSTSNRQPHHSMQQSAGMFRTAADGSKPNLQGANPPLTGGRCLPKCVVAPAGNSMVRAKCATVPVPSADRREPFAPWRRLLSMGVRSPANNGSVFSHATRVEAAHADLNKVFGGRISHRVSYIGVSTPAPYPTSFFYSACQPAPAINGYKSAIRRSLPSTEIR